MSKYNNPLPEYRDENGTAVPIEAVDIDVLYEEGEGYPDEQWYDEIYGLIGRFVVRFNSLEDTVEDLILGELNERAEDARVWVFLERMPTKQKIDALLRLYEVNFNRSELLASNPVRLRATNLKRELERINTQRNLYVHANWLNIATDDQRNLLVEHKTKRTRDGYYGRIRRSITIAEMNADIKAVRDIEEGLYEFDEQFRRVMDMQGRHIDITQGDAYAGNNAVVWSSNLAWPDLSTADLLFSTSEPFESSTLTYDADVHRLRLTLSKDETAARKAGIYTYEVRATIDGKVETIERGQVVVYTPEEASRYEAAKREIKPGVRP